MNKILSLILLGVSPLALASGMMELSDVALRADGSLFCMNLQEANQYCQQQGRRLPTKEEVEQGYELNSSLNTDLMVWTSSLYPDSDKAYYFEPSTNLFFYDSVDFVHFVRCVIAPTQI